MCDKIGEEATATSLTSSLLMILVEIRRDAQGFGGGCGFPCLVHESQAEVI